MRRATPPCSNWTKKGRCNKYECRFSHAGPQGPTPQTKQICPRWEKKGACKFGATCTLSHDDDAHQQSDQRAACPRWIKKGTCKFGHNCTLRHDGLTLQQQAENDAVRTQRQSDQHAQQQREVEKARKSDLRAQRQAAYEAEQQRQQEREVARKKAEEKARKKAEEKARKKVAEEANKVEDDEYENECQICMANPVYDSSGCSFMVAPCGHVFACEGCLNNLRDCGQGCAMCRGRIETVQKIYPTVKPPSSSGGSSFKTASVQLVEASSTMGLTVTRQVRRFLSTLPFV